MVGYSSRTNWCWCCWIGNNKLANASFYIVQIKFITTQKVPPRVVNWDLINFNLLRYDMERLWQKQKILCECLFGLATNEIDVADYRTKHGYPKYYDKIKAKKREIEKYYLDDLYKESLKGNNDVVKEVYF